MLKPTPRFSMHNLGVVTSLWRQLRGNITKERMVVQTIQRKNGCSNNSKKERIVARTIQSH